MSPWARCRRGAVTAVAGLIALVVVTGCGVPSQAHPELADPTSVPFGLLEPSTPMPPTPTPTTTSTPHAATFFVDRERLLGVKRPLTGTAPRERLEAVIRELSNGPTEAELADGLSTAIPAQLRLRVDGLEGDVATIALIGDQQTLGTEDKLAVAQIVLTATDVPGVAKVRLVQDGDQLSVPVADGSLSNQPLTAADYHMLTQ